MANTGENADQIIKALNLKVLEAEGGYWAQTYRSDLICPGSDSGREFCSAIYYLLTANIVSRMHRLDADEIYHFYLGSPVTMVLLHPHGKGETVTLGPDVIAGERLQVVVPRQTWQGSLLKEGGEFALMGTTMAPAFHPAGFELGDKGELSRAYPEWKELIWRLT